MDPSKEGKNNYQSIDMDQSKEGKKNYQSMYRYGPK